MADPNAEQIAYWNGPGGEHWTRRQDVHDAVLAPISFAAIACAAPRAGESAIDIGCGCGATTLELARLIAPGAVLGVDISLPMLARARERAGADRAADFIAADATVHAFAPSSADLVFSRFGVMFFAEPARAFANIRGALRTGGRLAFVCWREPAANPWLMTPLSAVYHHVPRLPDHGPNAPGPFAFAAAERVRRILAEAGFTGIALEPADFELDLAVGRGLEAAVETALEIGPASRALQDQPEAVRAAAAGSIREALRAAQSGATVPLAAGVWLVTARNP